jgi:hypothetical protein
MTSGHVLDVCTVFASKASVERGLLSKEHPEMAGEGMRYHWVVVLLGAIDNTEVRDASCLEDGRAQKRAAAPLGGRLHPGHPDAPNGSR